MKQNNSQSGDTLFIPSSHLPCLQICVDKKSITHSEGGVEHFGRLDKLHIVGKFCRFVSCWFVD